MQDNTNQPDHEDANGKYQYPEHFLRQDYHVRVEGGEEFVVPDAVPLAKTKMPDLAMALDMAGGVSGYQSGI
jgi:hypothetical protein